jgi:hypothetical protein
MVVQLIDRFFVLAGRPPPRFSGASARRVLYCSWLHFLGIFLTSTTEYRILWRLPEKSSSSSDYSEMLEIMFLLAHKHKRDRVGRNGGLLFISLFFP